MWNIFALGRIIVSRKAQLIDFMLLEEELALVARAKAGEQAALGTLWDALTPKLYGYLVNTLRDARLAEDLAQDTWLKAIGSLDKFQPRGVRFSAWLFAIARNECKQYWRKGGREMPIDAEAQEIPSPVDFTAGVGDKFEIEKVFKHLTETEQEILRLRYIGELSFKEIAGVLAISPLAARLRVHRTLTKTRALLPNA